MRGETNQVSGSDYSGGVSGAQKKGLSVKVHLCYVCKKGLFFA